MLESSTISLTKIKAEISKIEKATARQRDQQFGVVEEQPVRRALTGNGFFVSKADEERTLQKGGYKGVLGLTEEEMNEEFKEKPAAPRPTSGFFVSKEQEEHAERGYRGVSGMSSAQIEEEYKEEEAKKTPFQRSTWESSFGSKPGSWGEKKEKLSSPFGNRGVWGQMKSSGNPWKKKEED